MLLRKINNLVYIPAYLESVWVHLFAYFTLETLPVERSYILVLSIWWLLLLLGEHPVFQALEVDQAHRTFALTGDNQWIR